MHNLKKNSLFIKYINKRSKLIPFNNNLNTVGETKYFPATSKE